MSCAVASAASFEFACYHAQDVSIKMSDWARGLSPLIYNKGNKLKFGFFMGRILTQYQFAICLFLFLNVKTKAAGGISAAEIECSIHFVRLYVSSVVMAEKSFSTTNTKCFKDDWRCLTG